MAGRLIGDKRRKVSWFALSADARKLLYDMLTVPTYKGGLQSIGTQNEVVRLGLVRVSYTMLPDGTPRDLLFLTDKAKRYIKDPDYLRWVKNPFVGGKRRHSGVSKLAADVSRMLKE